MIEHQVGNAALDVDAITARGLAAVTKARVADDDIVGGDDKRPTFEPDAIAGCSLTRDGHFGFGEARLGDGNVATHAERDRATFWRNSGERFIK